MSCTGTSFASCTEAHFQIVMDFNLSSEGKHIVTSQNWMIMFVQEENSYILCFFSPENMLVAYCSSNMQFINK